MLKKIGIVSMVIAILLAIGYMLGPRERTADLAGEYPEVPFNLTELENYVRLREDTVRGLKPDNEAKIVWLDSLNKQKTEYAFVYIHGFGASEKEGHPIHRELAQYYGANLYLARLPEHGIKREDALKHLTAQDLADSAREAFSIGKSLGEKVVIIGTSMGGALSLMLASEQADIAAIVLYSPAIRDFGGRLDLFFNPWIKNIMENYYTDNGVVRIPREGDMAKYWMEEQHVNGFTSLAVLLKSKMTPETFSKITQPLFMGYYYEDDEHQDFVVSVPAMLEMFESIETPEHLKMKMSFEQADNHVIGSQITSEEWENVLEATKYFLSNTVGITVPIEQIILTD
ncbi:alpha/beta hydrolase [Anditalea andensis]|uniref:Alpha/beta hydrolase n=1 Tax=Anditalea andensis TaxID=1048983 RepID=A0A074LF72_9BACT|nr:alpha/beta fold hydrolase [Anditalea andensis]KEO72437.1 alpha/beta hydrolase [Anditalea andensis]